MIANATEVPTNADAPLRCLIRVLQKRLDVGNVTCRSSARRHAASYQTSPACQRVIVAKMDSILLNISCIDIPWVVACKLKITVVTR